MNLSGHIGYEKSLGGNFSTKFEFGYVRGTLTSDDIDNYSDVIYSLTPAIETRYYVNAKRRLKKVKKNKI